MHIYTYIHIHTHIYNTCIHTWKYTPSAARVQPAYSSIIVSSASSVSHFILFAYLCRCVTWLIDVWHDSLMCAMTRWCVCIPMYHVRHDSLVFVHMHHRFIGRQVRATSFDLHTYVTLCVSSCASSCSLHISVICVTCLTEVWHGSLMCVWTHWCACIPRYPVRHDSLIGVRPIDLQTHSVSFRVWATSYCLHIYGTCVT